MEIITYKGVKYIIGEVGGMAKGSGNNYGGSKVFKATGGQKGKGQKEAIAIAMSKAGKKK